MSARKEDKHHKTKPEDEPDSDLSDSSSESSESGDSSESSDEISSSDSDASKNRMRQPVLTGKKLLKKMREQMPTLGLLVAKSKSGKSHMLHHIISYMMNELNYFKFGMVFTKTTFNKDYDKWLPAKCIKEYDQDEFFAYVEALKAKREKANGAQLPPNFLILDDCLGSIQGTPEWNNFISIFRHLNTTLFITAQYMKTSATSTLVREQTGILVAFRSTNVNTADALYEYFGSNVFDNPRDFRKRYNAITKQKYTAMIYIDDNDMLTKDSNFVGYRAPKSSADVTF